ncbi:hypothetical protein D3C72_1528640 [compost metagenome]
MQEAGEVAVGGQNMQLLGKFLVKVRDALAGGLVGERDQQLAGKWAGFFDGKFCGDLLGRSRKCKSTFQRGIGRRRRHSCGTDGGYAKSKKVFDEHGTFSVGRKLLACLQLVWISSLCQHREEGRFAQRRFYAHLARRRVGFDLRQRIDAQQGVSHRLGTRTARHVWNMELKHVDFLIDWCTNHAGR